MTVSSSAGPTLAPLDDARPCLPLPVTVDIWRRYHNKRSLLVFVYGDSWDGVALLHLVALSRHLDMQDELLPSSSPTSTSPPFT